MTPRPIKLPEFEAALERISECHEDSGSDSSPISMRLFGVSGVGKSYAMKTYAAQHPPVEEPERTRIPVVYFSVPSAPTSKSVYIAFLSGMRQHLGSDTMVTLQRKAGILATNCGVEQLLVDEVHHLIDRGAAHSYAAAADALKELIDLLGVPVVFAGAPRTQILFGHNSQLRTRVMTTHVMKPFHPDRDLSTLRGFIFALTSSLNQDSREWLANEANAKRIFYATDGLHRCIALFLKLVCRWTNRGNELCDSLMANLFRSHVWQPPTSELNPFHPRFAMRRLNRRGEPFEPTYLDGDNHPDLI